MATQGQFQSAAHDHAMNGSHYRLGGVLDRQNHAQQVRFLHRFGAAKFLDVGTARESLAGPGDDDGPRRGLGIRFGQALGNPLARCQTQSVDWRVVQRDHGDVTVQLVLGSHACFPQW